jgi:hypothetical protein
MVSFSAWLSSIIFHAAVCNTFAASPFVVLTETVFNQLAPNASGPYTYAGTPHQMHKSLREYLILKRISS